MTIWGVCATASLCSHINMAQHSAKIRYKRGCWKAFRVLAVSKLGGKRLKAMRTPLELPSQRGKLAQKLCQPTRIRLVGPAGRQRQLCRHVRRLLSTVSAWVQAGGNHIRQPRSLSSAAEQCTVNLYSCFRCCSSLPRRWQGNNCFVSLHKQALLQAESDRAQASAGGL